MKNFELYKVGGCVRDKILGHDSKDIDFSFELKSEFIDKLKENPVEYFYDEMNSILKKEGFQIFLSTPSCFTTRARFPSGHKYEGLTADFVMCRKEEYLDKESRLPTVSIGNIYDDLARRDFRMNAIAEDEKGNLLDPFNGIKDIKLKIIGCPKSAHESFSEDHLRMLRAIRFCITKDFQLDYEVWSALKNKNYWKNLNKHVSIERIREELHKCFKYNSLRTIRLLNDIEQDGNISILEYLFENRIWLNPTIKN